MEPKTFEEYLHNVFVDQRPEVLDDDLPDAFDAWLSDIGVDVIIEYADAYARLFARQALQQIKETV